MNHDQKIKYSLVGNMQTVDTESEQSHFVLWVSHILIIAS